MRCGENVCYRCSCCVCSRCVDGDEVEEELWLCTNCGWSEPDIENLFDRYEDDEEE